MPQSRPAVPLAYLYPTTLHVCYEIHFSSDHKVAIDKCKLRNNECYNCLVESRTVLRRAIAHSRASTHSCRNSPPYERQRCPAETCQRCTSQWRFAPYSIAFEAVRAFDKKRAFSLFLYPEWRWICITCACKYYAITCRIERVCRIRTRIWTVIIKRQQEMIRCHTGVRNARRCTTEGRKHQINNAARRKQSSKRRGRCLNFTVSTDSNGHLV